MSARLESWIGKGAPASRRTRLGGAVLLLVGLFLLKVGVLDVLRDAEQQEASSLSISSSAVGLVPMALMLGAALLVAGPRALGLLQRMGVQRQADGRRPLRGWLFLAGFVAPGLLLYFWLRHRLAELGYDR